MFGLFICLSCVSDVSTTHVTPNPNSMTWFDSAPTLVGSVEKQPSARFRFTMAPTKTGKAKLQRTATSTHLGTACHAHSEVHFSTPEDAEGAQEAEAAQEALETPTEAERLLLFIRLFAALCRSCILSQLAFSSSATKARNSQRASKMQSRVNLSLGARRKEKCKHVQKMSGKHQA